MTVNRHLHVKQMDGTLIKYLCLQRQIFDELSLSKLTIRGIRNRLNVRSNGLVFFG